MRSSMSWMKTWESFVGDFSKLVKLMSIALVKPTVEVGSNQVQFSIPIGKKW